VMSGVVDVEVQFEKFVVRNLKTGESYHVQAPTLERALTVFCSDTPIGGSWKREDCTVVEDLKGMDSKGDV